MKITTEELRGFVRDRKSSHTPIMNQIWDAILECIDDRDRLDAAEKDIEDVGWSVKSWISQGGTLPQIVCATPGASWPGGVKTQTTARAAIDQARSQTKCSL